MPVDQNGKPVCCERCGHDLVQYLTHVSKRVGSPQNYEAALPAAMFIGSRKYGRVEYLSSGHSRHCSS
jgi:hypothetical protein